MIFLSKKDLVNMVSSMHVPYELIEEYTNRHLGKFYGGMCQEWEWNKLELNNLSKIQLYKEYLRLKQNVLSSTLFLRLSICLFLIIFFSFATYKRNEYRNIYDEAVILLEDGEYKSAVERFNDIPDYEYYKDVAKLLDLKQICPKCGQTLFNN